MNATLSVVIATWRRAASLQRCLEALSAEASHDVQIIVVDASEDEESKLVARDFGSAEYYRFPPGAGHMTTSRNFGLQKSTGMVVAFIDDDTYVRRGWAESVTSAFEDPAVGAICGRTINPGDTDEEIEASLIGSLASNGTLSANFHSNARSALAVQHGIGANMAFRRSVLQGLGGFRDDFPGTALREDTDMFLRVGAAGFTSRFVPSAVALHVGAPHARGRRFDYRYQFWARHNHMLLLTRNFGWGSPLVWHWIGHDLHQLATNRSATFLRHLIRFAMGVLALAAGTLTSLRKARWRPLPPWRHVVS